MFKPLAPAPSFFPLPKHDLLYYNFPLCLLRQLLITFLRSSIDMLSAGKRSSTKSTVVFTLLSLIGIALTLDFFWASSSTSSSSSYSSPFSNWDREKNQILVVSKPKIDTEGNYNVPELELSGTFADLPAPELEWEQMASAPVPRLDGSAIQIEDLLYVFSGYGNLDHVHSHVDVYDFRARNWTERFETPKEMANSHLGVASDGRRYVYIVSGQHCPQCTAPPVALSFVLDTRTRKWESIPSLPAPRYAPATQIWRGRLHVMGGSKENRHTPATDHWSIAVENGRAIEKEWRKELPLPRGGPHRACVAVGDNLFVIGGQEGDFMPKPGSPIFKCSRRHEVVYGDVYMLDGEMKWKAVNPMPKPDSHIESSWIIWNNSIVIMGGTTEKHPVTKRMILVGEIFQFHLDTMQWSVMGRMPYRVKTTLAGFWDGWLYFTSGQRDRGEDNPQPKKVIAEMWRTRSSF